MNPHLLRSIIEGSSDCIAVLDTSLTFVLANKAYQAEFARLYGRPLTIGDRLHDIFADLPDHLRRAEVVARRALAGQTFRLRTEAGSADRGLYDFAVHPIVDETGNIYGLAQIVRPVSEADRQLDHVLDCAKAGIWTWRPEAADFVYDRRHAKLLGLDPLQAPSYQAWLGAIDGVDREAVDAAMRRLAEGEQTWLRMTCRVDDPSGGRRWLALFGRAEEGGRRLAGVCIDISELREVEKTLSDARTEASAALAEAERAALAKSQFFAAVSHDLRQPAQSLLLLSSLLKMRAEGTVLADLAEPLEQAVGALKQLLDGVLDIARLDAGVVKAQEETVAVGEIIRRLAWEYSDRAADLGLVLLHVDSSMTVRTDPVLFERILRQYLENALRFTPRGRILLGCRRRGGRCSVEVVDTGIGIAEHERQTIFEEFYQVGNVARDRTLGLGLGLAVVRRLAEIIDAEVGVSSAPGRGSRFSISLPMAALPGAGLEDVPFVSEPLPGTAFVIEDDGMILACFRLLLERWGYRVATATTGERALELVMQGLRPSFILADYRLGGAMTGRDAIQAIRQACGHELPALVVTGATESAAPCQDGKLTVLYKPVRMETLRTDGSTAAGPVGLTGCGKVLMRPSPCRTAGGRACEKIGGTGLCAGVPRSGR